MAVLVVDRLELVQVDEEHRETLLPVDGLLDQFQHAGAVEQPGQGIAFGQPADSLFGGLVAADVVKHENMVQGLPQPVAYRADPQQADMRNGTRSAGVPDFSLPLAA